MGNSIFVRCSIEAGAFSGERVIGVRLVESGKYLGVAPIDYCYTREGQQLATTTIREKTDNGKLAARLVRDVGDSALIYMPDGETIEVPAEEVEERK